MNKKIVFGLIGAALVVGGIFFYNKQNKSLQNDQSKSQEEKELNLAREELTVASSSSIYASLSDKEFVAFAESKIESKCPFYVPDGVTYRQCLSDWVELLQKNVAGGDKQTIGRECENFVSKNSESGSIEAGELYAKCLIYRLSKLFNP